MKKTLFILGMLLIANYAGATWSEPTATPPNNNVPAPINVGTVDQVKGAGITATKFCIGSYCLNLGTGGLSLNGGLTTSSISTTGNISAGGFCIGGDCIASWSGLNNKLNFLTGAGVSGRMAKWNTSSGLGYTSFTESDVQNAVNGAGLWAISGNAVIPSSGRVINSGASSLKVQIGTPASPQDGMIWLAQ